ncbi:MAG: pyridoxal-phosphate dependent enzyme [bacterium]
MSNETSLSKLPRIDLGIFPTPLHELPTFSKTLGGPRIFIKREDLSGNAFGGNKTRQVERLLAHARQQGSNAIIACSSSQSNYCLQVAAGARKLGWQVGVVQYSGQHPEMQGNRLLQHIIGSHERILEGSIMSPSFLDHRIQAMEDMASKFRAEGYTPYIARTDPPTPYFSLCASGWVDGAVEIHQQLKELGINSAYLITACSSGCTTAGLVLGFRMLASDLKVIAVAASRTREIAHKKILTAANSTAEYIGAQERFSESDIDVRDYIGESYGIVSAQSMEATWLLARTEGIFLDPVYSAKAMAGLIDMVRRGEFTANDTVVFLHTGGTPAIFAYQKEIQDYHMK